MKFSLSKILFASLVLTVILFLVIYFFPVLVLRVALGIPFLLFYPGFVLMAAIAPNYEDCTTTERLTLSLVLSMLVISLLGFILHYTSFGITVNSILVTVTVFIELFTAVGLIRQLTLPHREQAFIEFDFRLARTSSGLLNTSFIVITALVLAGALASGLYFTFMPKSDESFTQFYLLKQDKGGFYSPRVFTPGTNTTVTLGIKNHEGDDVNYSIQVFIDEQYYTEINQISLADGQEWQENIPFPVLSADEKELEFLLFKDNESQPYMESLRLWVGNPKAETASQQ